MEDLQGLALSTRSPAAASAFNEVIRSYVGNRVDLFDRLKETLNADPEFALAHCAKGYFMMLAYNTANLPVAAEARDVASRLSSNSREKKHIEALSAWIEGDLPRTLYTWEQILAVHPTDAMALRLSHYKYFWTGRREDMRRSVERAAQAWSDTLPLYGSLLGCRAFAAEECGHYAEAERFGRRAVEIDPADGWATHAVAHVMEMQGRHKEGVEWLASLAGNWTQFNNFQHHLWWHRAMFHVERREFDAVLELYDQRFRNLSSPLVKKLPDMFIDVQNAASMLFRLELRGIDVGERWKEIADKAEARIGDHLSAFTQPHWMMALAATGRDGAAARMLASMRGSSIELINQVALPVCEAVLAHRKGQYDRAVDLMTPVLDRMAEMGGSHAQHDVLTQLYLDSALKGKRDADVKRTLERVAKRFPVPPARRIAYSEAAARFLS